VLATFATRLHSDFRKVPGTDFLPRAGRDNGPSLPALLLGGLGEATCATNETSSRGAETAGAIVASLKIWRSNDRRSLGT